MNLETRIHAARKLVSILDAAGAQELARAAATEFLMSIPNDDFWNPRFLHYFEATHYYLDNTQIWPIKIANLREELADLAGYLLDPGEN